MIANQGALKVPLNTINTLISEHLCPAMPPTACIPIISQSQSHENGIIRDTDWRLIRLLPGAGGSLVIVDTCQTEIQMLQKARSTTLIFHCKSMFNKKRCLSFCGHEHKSADCKSRCTVLAPGALHFPIRNIAHWSQWEQLCTFLHSLSVTGSHWSLVRHPGL